jgi:hypothetical protein
MLFFLLVGTEDSKQTCAKKDVARTTQSDLRIFMVERRIEDMDESIDDLGRTQCLRDQTEGEMESETKLSANDSLNVRNRQTTYQRHTANLLVRSLPAHHHGQERGCGIGDAESGNQS